MFEADLPVNNLKLKDRYTGELTRLVCDINYRSVMVNLTLDEKRNLSMKTAALSYGFCYDHLHLILGMLGYYGDELFLELNKKIEEIERRRSLIKNLI